MDYDRCLTTSSRYYDAWPFPAAGLPTYPALRDQHDYPSPAPSCSDPSPVSRTLQSLDSYTTNDFTVAPFNHIESSIGPVRSTRRHTSLRQSAHGRRWSLSSNGFRDQDTSLPCPGSQMPDDALPRTETPPLSRYGDKCTPTLPSISPSLYQPNTPVSMPSPFSPYDPSRRSRTRSDSNSDRRTQSPSLDSKSPRTSPPSPQAPQAGDPLAHLESSGPTRPKKRERHHKHKLCDQDRKAICLYHLQHPNARQEDIGTVFGVERSTISKILKDKDRWLHISDEDQGNDLTAKHRPSKFPEVEFEMVKSLQEWADRAESITDQLIRQRALEIARSFGMPPEKFKGSSGWIENFKHRHNIRRGEWLRARTTHQGCGSSPSAFTPALPSDSFKTSNNSSHPGDLVIDPALQDASQNGMHPMAPIQHSPTVTYGIRYGSPLLHTREESPPSFAQAEHALDVVLAYLDTSGHEFCKPNERETLQHLKWAMFQHANGISYERPT